MHVSGRKSGDMRSKKQNVTAYDKKAQDCYLLMSYPLQSIVESARSLNGHDCFTHSLFIFLISSI